MDKYEYKLKSEQIKKLYEEGDFRTLLNIADSFDWRKITSNVLLNIVSDAYEQVGKIDKAYKLLLMAYSKTAYGRNLAYRLSLLSLKLGKVTEAIDYYTDFVRKAPKDPNQFILKYEILKAKKADSQDLIKALEAYLLLDIDEKWEYELAMLYHQSGQEANCIEMCNRLSLWFSDSEYVKSALDLKKEYMPLMAWQEVKYEKAMNNQKAMNNEELKSDEELKAINYGTINDAKLNDEELNDEELINEGYETFHYEPDEQEMLMDVVKSISEFTMDDENEEVKNEELNEENINEQAELDDDDAVYDDGDMEELSLYETPVEEELPEDTYQEEINAMKNEELESINNEEIESINDEKIESKSINDEELKAMNDEEPEIQEQENQEQVNQEIDEDDDQIDGQMTLESLLEVHQEQEDEAVKKLEEERLERAAFIAEKARLLREEIERQNEVELDGPFGDIFAKEFAETEDSEEVEEDEHPEEENFVYGDLIGDIEEESIKNERLDNERLEEECYCLTPELRILFERYLPINKMEEQLAETLDQLINFYEEDGTSSANNIVIMGDEKSGKTSLIIDIIKVINCKRNRNGRKVAKIKGESLNRKGMEVTMPKLFGADLIIERAGNLNPETVQGIIKTMKDYTEDMIVILEDSEVALERLFKVNSELVEMFGNVIKIKEIGVKEWVEIAKEYARKRGYIVDEMGTLALHVKIGNVYSRELKLEADEIECVIDDAIEKAKRKKRYAKKHRIEGFAVLREADFM